MRFSLLHLPCRPTSGSFSNGQFICEPFQRLWSVRLKNGLQIRNCEKEMLHRSHPKKISLTLFQLNCFSHLVRNSALHDMRVAQHRPSPCSIRKKFPRFDPCSWAQRPWVHKSGVPEAVLQQDVQYIMHTQKKTYVVNILIVPETLSFVSRHRYIDVPV